MITAAEASYLHDCIKGHLRRFYSRAGQSAFDAIDVRFVPASELSHPPERTVMVPIDIPVDVESIVPWTVPFGASKLTLWNRLAAPTPDWKIDNESIPLWYRHPSGAVMPAWNLAPTLLGLLTLREERATSRRDVHGRYVGAMSPRYRAGVLDAPIFNDSVAALVAACDGMRHEGTPAPSLSSGMVAEPWLVLSHDLDQLRGDDWWTQGARLSRMARPRSPSIRWMNLWFVVLNALRPQLYYLDNLVGMIEVERMLGFTSSLYVLNGVGGRFGARSGLGPVQDMSAVIPDRWPIGMHYNYDTFLDRKRFDAQRDELQRALSVSVCTGRAHYLRFDGRHSWRFLAEVGVRVDESLGYPDAVGYRAGIAGPFAPFDEESGSVLPLLEMPLVAMESALTEGGAGAAIKRFTDLLDHLRVVGGALSLLFHPGVFHNPEYPETQGVYRRLLGIARDHGARSVTASQMGTAVATA